MTLVDAWHKGAIRVPWSNLAKTNRERLFRVRRGNADYYLIGGQRPKNNKVDNDELIILEVADDGTSRILMDTPASKPNKFKERLKIATINIETLSKALGFAVRQDAADKSTVYDPKAQYVVDRAKVGRPRRILTDTEKADIDRLRAQGLSINAISRELSINNRRVMEHCRYNSCNMAKRKGNKE